MSVHDQIRKATSTLAVGIALSLVAAGEARAVPRACCLPDGTCEILSRTICEDQMGGNSEEPGTDCSMVECPVLCSGSAPACNGECPAGEVCATDTDGVAATTAGNGNHVACSCFPEIPAGGACDPLSDQCAPGLTCVNGVCAAPAAGAPALSPLGLVALAGTLVAFGGVALLRRRRD